LKCYSSDTASRVLVARKDSLCQNHLETISYLHLHVQSVYTYFVMGEKLVYTTLPFSGRLITSRCVVMLIWPDYSTFICEVSGLRLLTVIAWTGQTDTRTEAWMITLPLHSRWWCNQRF